MPFSRRTTAHPAAEPYHHLPQEAAEPGSPSRLVKDDDFDRGFYLGDEDGGPVDDGEESDKFLGDAKKFAEREADMAR